MRCGAPLSAALLPVSLTQNPNSRLFLGVVTSDVDPNYSAYSIDSETSREPLVICCLLLLPVPLCDPFSAELPASC
jgi:hypothetical protein